MGENRAEQYRIEEKKIEKKNKNVHFAEEEEVLPQTTEAINDEKTQPRPFLPSSFV